MKSRDRIILHCDLNSFYASVECFQNPDIRELPVAVCGDPEMRHGIVLAKNLKAKAYGVATAEPIWQARQKCPQLLVVKPNYDQYMKVSRCARSIYGRYTDQVEPFGIDECWLDVTGSTHLFGSGRQIADRLRREIYEELGITASVGVSFNKIFAKLGSDLRKPDFTTEITREDFRETIWKLPAMELLGVGGATMQKLEKMGVYTIGDMARADPKRMANALGKWGLALGRLARGEDDSPVSLENATSVSKSVGNSVTLPRDVATLDEARNVLYMLAESVAARLREQGLKCTTVQISFRDKDMAGGTRQGKLPFATYLSGEIAEKAIEVFRTLYQFNKPLRNLGVTGTGLVGRSEPVQLDLFGNALRRERQERLEVTVDRIRGRYGFHSIQKGIIFEDRDLTGANPKEENLFTPIGYFKGPVA